jgi:TonB family protein
LLIRSSQAVIMGALSSGGRHDQAPRTSANDRLKKSWNLWLYGSLAGAAMVHALVFTFWPVATIDQEAYRRGSPATILVVGAAPEVRTPLPPADLHISAPAIPIIAPVEVETLQTPVVSLPTFHEPVFAHRPAVVPGSIVNPDRWLDYESFAPYLSYPRIRNEQEVERFLSRHYEPLLQLTGASGVVQVAFWIDEGGEVWKAELAESSGFRVLDGLAMRLSGLLRFSPAMRLGQPVRVQVRVPITFRDT